MKQETEPQAFPPDGRKSSLKSIKSFLALHRKDSGMDEAAPPKMGIEKRTDIHIHHRVRSSEEDFSSQAFDFGDPHQDTLLGYFNAGVGFAEHGYTSIDGPWRVRQSPAEQRRRLRKKSTFSLASSSTKSPSLPQTPSRTSLPVEPPSTPRPKAHSEPTASKSRTFSIAAAASLLPSPLQPSLPLTLPKFRIPDFLKPRAGRSSSVCTSPHNNEDDDVVKDGGGEEDDAIGPHESPRDPTLRLGVLPNITILELGSDVSVPFAIFAPAEEAAAVAAVEQDTGPMEEEQREAGLTWPHGPLLSPTREGGTSPESVLRLPSPSPPMSGGVVEERR